MKYGLVTLILIALLHPLNGFSEARPEKISAAWEKYRIALGHRSVSAIVKALTERGAASKTSHPDSAYMDLMFALKLANRFKLMYLRPGIFIELAGLHAASADLKTAVAYYDSARNAATRISDYATLASALNLLGTLQFDLDNHPEAKSLFKKSYKTAISHALFSHAGVALSNLARYCEEPDSAVQKMRQAISLITRKMQTDHVLSWVYINIGNRMSNPDSAICYYEKSMIAMQGQPDYPVIVMQAMNNMAYSLIEKGNPGKADELLRLKAIPIALTNKDYDWLATLYDTRADVLEAQLKHEEAFRCEKMAIKTRAMAESRKASQQVRMLLMLLEVRNKDVRIATAQLQISSQRQNITKLRRLLLSLSALIILVTIGVVVFRQRTKIKLQQQEILTIRRHAEAADEERNRMSRQLHDLSGRMDKKMVAEIGQLTSVDKSVLDELEAAWRRISPTIHSLSYRLNRDMFAELPLMDSIRSLVDEYNQIGEAQIIFKTGKGTVFPRKYKSHAGYIIQELLNNALKHGGVCDVELQLTLEAGNHYLFYHDNGPGFDKPASLRSMGISNIFERAKLMGGKATLITSPGKGTRWIVAVPFNEHDENEQVG